MSKSKKIATNEGKDINDGETWKKHKLYDFGCSINRIVTRSQTPFARIKNTDSDLKLFADPSNYHPPGLPHLMVTMKGEYGAIPTTVITRSTGKLLELSQELMNKLEAYKKKAGIAAGSSGSMREMPGKKGNKTTDKLSDDDDWSFEKGKESARMLDKKGSKTTDKLSDDDDWSFEKGKESARMPEKRRRTGEKIPYNKEETWRNHNLYDVGCSINRIVTRSQTAFNRIKNTDSDLELFADPSSYQPPGLPHLMVTMKGEFGAIPNTIITRSTGKHLEVSPNLCNRVDEYKKKKRKSSS